MAAVITTAKVPSLSLSVPPTESLPAFQQQQRETDIGQVPTQFNSQGSTSAPVVKPATEHFKLPLYPTVTRSGRTVKPPVRLQDYTP